MSTEPRILLVVLDREFADPLCRRLLRSGFQVTALRHPRQALEAASLRDYDVAVLDYDLPEFDGLALMRKLNRRVANLPAVLLSARAGSEDEDDALAHGAFACLAKSCRLTELAAVIERAAACRREREAEQIAHRAPHARRGSFARRASAAE